MRRLIKQHKNKIVYTTPFIFFLFFGMNLLAVPELLPREIITLVSVDEKYSPAIGEVFFADVMVTTDMPINAVETALSYPVDMLEIKNISKDGSFLDLWPKEPTFSNSAGTLDWSGGTVRPGGFTGSGKILNIAFTGKKAGSAEIRFNNAIFAAYDGKGTILFPAKNGLIYTIRPKAKPSPDINGDGAISFADISLWIAAYFRAYDPRYDLNADGKTTTADLSVFLSK